VSDSRDFALAAIFEEGHADGLFLIGRKCLEVALQQTPKFAQRGLMLVVHAKCRPRHWTLRNVDTRPALAELIASLKVKMVL